MKHIRNLLKNTFLRRGDALYPIRQALQIMINERKS